MRETYDRFPRPWPSSSLATGRARCPACCSTTSKTRLGPTHASVACPRPGEPLQVDMRTHSSSPPTHRICARLAPGALVYALIACDACETSEARQALESLEERLDRTHATLAGCALIPLAETLETSMRGPRMGHARRNVSEATDELVLALRCADEAGIIDVRPPWPCALCHLLASRRR